MNTKHNYMPTGHTTGVLTGEFKDIEDFAKSCMRSFGALIHMRDDDGKSEYKPRIPTDYHQQRIDEAKLLIESTQMLNDAQIIENKRSKILKEIEMIRELVAESLKNKDKLQYFLEEALKWKAPSKDHIDFKKFMINQLEITIEQDGDSSYYENEIELLKKDLTCLNADVIRKKIMADAKRNISHHTIQHTEEVKRCNESNKWVSDLLNSFK